LSNWVCGHKDPPWHGQVHSPVLTLQANLRAAHIFSHSQIKELEGGSAIRDISIGKKSEDAQPTVLIIFNRFDRRMHRTSQHQSIDLKRKPQEREHEQQDFRPSVNDWHDRLLSLCAEVTGFE